MHETTRDTRETSGKHRFDGESARRILARAAATQQRLDNELADSYSLEELEEMAAEAGISAEALRAAVEEQRCGSDPVAGRPGVPDEGPRHRLSAVRRLMPGNWTTTIKTVVLTSVGVIGFGGALLAFPMVAETVLWALLLFLILLTVLMVLGASPF